MCLTIPAKILKIDKNIAIINDGSKIKKIDIGILSNIKIGDWILYLNKIAVKKISAHDAKEILEILAKTRKININRLNPKFVKLFKKVKIKF